MEHCLVVLIPLLRFRYPLIHTKHKIFFCIDQNQHYVPISITKTLNRSFIKVIKYCQGLNDPKISCQSNDHDLSCETERLNQIGLCKSDGLLQLRITIGERDITDTNLKFIGIQIIQLPFLQVLRKLSDDFYLRIPFII